MGNSCGCASRDPQKKALNTIVKMIDLQYPIIPFEIDEHTKIEMQLPFYRTNLVSFLARLYAYAKL